MNFKNLLKIAINASVKGGHAIMKIYSSEFTVEHKEDKSPLTLADKNCHTIIEQDLMNTDIPILSEEGEKIPYDKRKRWEYYWLIDALDGTVNFLNQIPFFCVSIAYIKNNIITSSAIYAPIFDDLYFASRGIGSFKNNSKLEVVDSKFEESLFSVAFSDVF